MIGTTRGTTVFLRRKIVFYFNFYGRRTPGDFRIWAQIFFLRLKVACKFLGSSITCEASEKRAVPSLMDLLVFCHSNPEVCPLYQYKEKMSFKKEMHFAEELSAGFLGERYLSEKDHHQTRSDRSHFSRLEKEEKARLSDVLKSRVPTNLANSRCVDTRDK